jgi:hypothetical protein
MKHLKSQGVMAFWFADPNFSLSRKRLVNLLEVIIDEVPGISFWCQTRYDLVDEELLSLLKRAGADNVAYGLESANTSVLERIHKPIDLQRLSRVIHLTHEAGISVELFSMFGLPGETFDQALSTLEFVKQNKVAVDGNSISQQAHLFFGTPMNDSPAEYGFRLFERTRPAYLSVCRDYETDTMSADEIRRISLIWRLNRNDFAEDLEAGRNLFHRAAFIIQNRKALADQPEASCLLTRIYLALEEYASALDCMKLLNKESLQHPTVKELLKGPFLCFKISREKARKGFKVIYDCQGSLDGRLVPATCGRFQEAILGNGVLLPEFETQLLGLSPGEYARFDMTFPAYYGQSDLAGKTVTFRIHVHHFLEPVTVESYEDLDDEALGNPYELVDTDGLRQYNINLYYKVFRGIAMREPTMDMTDSLMLINLYLKLGFVDQAIDIAGGLVDNPVVLTHTAHVFRSNDQPGKALELLDGAKEVGPRARLIRAEALFDLDRLEESEETVKEMKLTNNVELAELRVNLAARLALPIETFLEREEVLLEAKTQAML